MIKKIVLVMVYAGMPAYTMHGTRIEQLSASLKDAAREIEPIVARHSKITGKRFKPIYQEVIINIAQTYDAQHPEILSYKPNIILGNLLAGHYTFGKQALPAGEDPEDYGFVKIAFEAFNSLVPGQKLIVKRSTGNYTYGLYFIHKTKVSPYSSIELKKTKIAVGFRNSSVLNKELWSRDGAPIMIYTHPSWTGNAAYDYKMLDQIQKHIGPFIIHEK